MQSLHWCGVRSLQDLRRTCVISMSLCMMVSLWTRLQTTRMAVAFPGCWRHRVRQFADEAQSKGGLMRTPASVTNLGDCERSPWTRIQNTEQGAGICIINQLASFRQSAPVPDVPLFGRARRQIADCTGLGEPTTSICAPRRQKKILVALQPDPWYINDPATDGDTAIHTSHNHHNLLPPIPHQRHVFSCHPRRNG